MYPRIIEFLGFEPWTEPETLAEQLLVERRRRGWSMRKAVQVIGVDEGTWRKWESGNLPRPRERGKLAAFFDWTTFAREKI